MLWWVGLVKKWYFWIDEIDVDSVVKGVLVVLYSRGECLGEKILRNFLDKWFFLNE